MPDKTVEISTTASGGSDRLPDFQPEVPGIDDRKRLPRPRLDHITFPHPSSKAIFRKSIDNQHPDFSTKKPETPTATPIITKPSTQPPITESPKAPLQTEKPQVEKLQSSIHRALEQYHQGLRRIQTLPAFRKPASPKPEATLPTIKPPTAPPAIDPRDYGLPTDELIAIEGDKPETAEDRETRLNKEKNRLAAVQEAIRREFEPYYYGLRIRTLDEIDAGKATRTRKWKFANPFGRGKKSHGDLTVPWDDTTHDGAFDVTTVMQAERTDSILSLKSCNVTIVDARPNSETNGKTVTAHIDIDDQKPDKATIQNISIQDISGGETKTILGEIGSPALAELSANIRAYWVDTHRTFTVKNGSSPIIIFEGALIEKYVKIAKSIERYVFDPGKNLFIRQIHHKSREESIDETYAHADRSAEEAIGIFRALLSVLPNKKVK